jgi:hypothetical protein
MIRSWPAIEWYLPSDEDRWPAFLHLSTHIRTSPDDAGRSAGDTVWLGHVAGQSVGLAWEWVELRPGVVMMADPNSIITNARFAGPGRGLDDELHALICANRLANLLGWQQVVCAAVDFSRRQGGTATPAAPTLAARAAADPGSLAEGQAIPRRLAA